MGLAQEAVRTLACHRGSIRSRLRHVDPEFFCLAPADLPESSRALYRDLKRSCTRLKPRGDEGTLSATFGRCQLSTLEGIAAAILDLEVLIRAASL